jgi:protein TonB
MFESSLVESTPLLKSQNRGPALLSFAIQAIAVVALVIIPLTHPEVIPFATPKISLVAPRFIPKPPPVVVQPVRVRTENSTPMASAPTQAPRLSQQAFRSEAQTVDQPSLAVGLNLGDSGPNPLSALASTSPTGSRVVAAPSSAAPSTGPLRISNMLAGMLIAPIRPAYPSIARISRTQGTVVVRAIISKTGQIESAHAVSGPEMLQAAALDAVRAARYRPYLLNGQPIDVETTISINFQLGG